MKHLASRELFAYWQKLRGTRASPERGDIDPVAIRDILADTFMLDVDMKGGFPFLLAGTRVNGLFDAEQKNRPFLSLWRAEERRNIAAMLMTVADGPCPVVAGAEATFNEQGPIALECLFLPLRHHGKTHSRILGLIKPTTKSPALGLLPIGAFQLKSLRIVDSTQGERLARMPADQDWAPREWATEERATQERATEGGMERLAQRHPSQGPEASGPATRPHLRVIQGGL